MQGKITDFVRPIKATSFEQVDKKPARNGGLRGVPIGLCKSKVGVADVQYLRILALSYAQIGICIALKN